MSSSISCSKSLWNLVCESSVQTGEEVLQNELKANEESLQLGGIRFKAPNSGTADKFKQRKDVSEKWIQFILKLSQVLGVQEDQAWTIFQDYLAGTSG